MIKSIWFMCVTSTLIAINSMAASDSDSLVARLKSGGHVLMVRHANAPGTGDPPHFTVDDCSTPRNLDDTGRLQAQQIGQWLRERGIVSARIYSSQWCRCLETARLMDLGPVLQLPALNSFFESPRDREPNLKSLRHFLAQQPTNGELIVLVTHYVTISAVTGEGVLSGEGVVLQLAPNGAVDYRGRMGFD
jgi:phosphohistidine phosphatase SixA